MGYKTTDANTKKRREIATMITQEVKRRVATDEEGLNSKTVKKNRERRTEKEDKKRK